MIFAYTADDRQTRILRQLSNGTHVLPLAGHTWQKETHANVDTTRMQRSIVEARTTGKVSSASSIGWCPHIPQNKRRQVTRELKYESDDLTMIITKLGGNNLENGLVDHDEGDSMVRLVLDAVMVRRAVPSVDAIMNAINATFAFWIILHALILIIICIPVDALYKKCCTNLLYNTWKRVYPKPQYLRWFVNIMPLLLICATHFIMALDPSTAMPSTLWHGWQGWLLLLRPLRGAAAVLTICLLQFHVRDYADRLVQIGVDQYLELEYQIQEEWILQFQPPKKLLRAMISVLDKYIVRSQIFGIENLHKTKKVTGNNNGKQEEEYIPGLYVMNHMLHGIESPFFINKLYQETSDDGDDSNDNDNGIYLRGLADHFHLSIPVHSSIFQRMGAVDGTRRYLDLLMKHSQHALVYPGGSLEVHRRVDQPKYKLMWKNRLGFARHAIKHGYPIIPCASVGFDDMIDRLGDVPMNFLRKDLSLSIPGPIFPHRIQRLYFWIGEPICTKKYDGKYSNDEYARQVRDLTKAAIESGITFLQQKQAKDPERYLFPGLANAIDRLRNSKI